MDQNAKNTREKGGSKATRQSRNDTIANRGYYVMTADTVPTISITEFHAHVGETINRVHFSQQPMIITNRGEPYVILLPLTYIANYGGLELIGTPIDEPQEEPGQSKENDGEQGKPIQTPPNSNNE